MCLLWLVANEREADGAARSFREQRGGGGQVIGFNIVGMGGIGPMMCSGPPSAGVNRISRFWKVTEFNAERRFGSVLELIDPAIKCFLVGQRGEVNVLTKN